MVSRMAFSPKQAAQVLAERPVFRHVFEISLVILAFLFYFLVRGSVVDRTSEALQRGFQIINLERELGFFWELEMQAMVSGSEFLIKMFNFIYFWFEFPLIAAVGLWMYFRRRRQYTLTRDAMLISGGIALIIYHLFPVAPPRFLPEFGFIDTMREYSELSYQAETAAPFVNPYAAVPSLHVGWPFLLAIGIILAVHFRPLWVLAAMLPVAQFFAVVTTGNHYILDAPIGIVVALLGLTLAIALQKWGYSALGRLLGLSPGQGTGPKPAAGAA